MSRFRVRQQYRPHVNPVGPALCSQRLIDVFEQASVPFTAHPATVVNDDTSEPLSGPYFVWVPHPQVAHNSIDWDRRDVQLENDYGERRLTKLVLTTRCIAAQHPLFVPDDILIYLVHDRVRSALEAASITGIAFAPLDSVHWAELGPRKQQLERHLQAHLEDGQAWYELGDLLRLLWRYEDAVQALDRALKLQPELGKAWWARGDVLRSLGRATDALASFRHVTELEPENWAYGWREVCSISRDLGRVDEAFEIAWHGVQKRPDLSWTWFQFGKSLATAGRYDDALEAWNSVRGGPYAQLVEAKGDTLMRLQRFESAAEVYSDGAEYFPWRVDFWLGKADALQAVGRVEEAKVARDEAEQQEAVRAARMKELPH
jgi:Flp pilus assembly protein TadD